MPEELQKTYDPAAVEAEAYRVWLEEGAFRADPAAPGPAYCIVIPPPNVTGALHLGHAINGTLQDILIRNHRMRGFNTLWVPGIDHAGIATQAVVEKQLKEQENKTRHDLGREALVKRIWDWKEQYGLRILEQLKRIGCSCDWDRTRFTLDDMCARAVRETFFKLFADGLIYRGKRLVNWDIYLQTSISDDEIYHETVKTSLWHIRYPIEGTAKSMVVATTRPETMLGDTAVAVHPADPRWNWAIGKSVRLPLTDRLIPIISDPVLVNMEFGTGCVKVTPAHDPNDYACWQRQAGKIDIINILTPEGRMNQAAGGRYQGMTRDAARKKVVADLLEQGLLEKEEPYETQVGHSDRSKTPIEPYLSDQWFVTMAPLAEPALEAVRDGRVRFTPQRYAKTYLDWLGEKRDWPISRQLWWGHRIPVWAGPLDTIGGKRQLIEEYSRAHAEQANARVMGDALYVCVNRDEDGAIAGVLEGHGLVQDADVLDTWFSSALWPHSTLGWPEKTAELARYYPTSVLTTDRGIITLWVARMVMTGLYNMGQVPFHRVYIHPTILDGHGERMSKSKGNGVDPVEIIQAYGADALRFTLAQMLTETQDVRMPVKKDAQGRNTSDKFDLGRNFCNKLWNAARFALGNLGSIKPEPVDQRSWSLAERWIISRLGRTIAQIDAALEEYRFDAYAKLVYDLFWRDFCDWYLETIKPALKDPARQGQTANVLAATFDATLRLMHPVIPFITETIWWRLCEVRPERGLAGLLESSTSQRLIAARWPDYTTDLPDERAEREFAAVQEVVGAIRNVRNEHKVDPKKSLAVSVAAEAGAWQVFDSNREVIQLLAVCQISRLDGNPPAGAARATAGGCELFVAGLADGQAEQQRLGKRRSEVEGQIKALEARLANPGYAAKAPAHLVEQTKAQLAEARAELAKLQA